MFGGPNSQDEIFPPADLERGQHLYESSERRAVEKAERRQVSWRRLNPMSTTTLQRANYCVLGVAQAGLELVQFMLEINSCDEFVVSPNLSPHPVRQSRTHGQVRNVARRNGVARRRRRNAQTDFIIWA